MQAHQTNITRYHQASFNEAVHLAVAGQYDAGLDIIWGLRMQPDLGHLHRALVNLYIADFADPELHDLAKFCRACIDSLAILRAQGPLDQAIEDLEDKAVRRLTQVEEERVKREAEDAEIAEDDEQEEAEEEHELTWETQGNDEPIVPWEIEDLHKNSARKSRD